LNLALAGSPITVLATPEFNEIYSRGWYAHARLLSYALLIYFIGTSTKKKIFTNLTALAIFICIAISQVKSWMMIPIIAGILYRILSSRAIVSYKKVFGFVIVFFGIFNIAYLRRRFSQNIRRVHVSTEALLYISIFRRYGIK
jgi:hypothetical protein